MNAHLSDSEVRRFIRHDVPADRAMLIDDHLAACADCRSRAAAIGNAASRVTDLNGYLLGLETHLTDDEIQLYAGGHLTGVEQTRLQRHLVECTMCEREVTDLTAWASRPSTPVEVDVADAVGRSSDRPWIYVAAAAVVLLILTPVAISRWVGSRAGSADVMLSNAPPSATSTLFPQPASPEGTEPAQLRLVPVPVAEPPKDPPAAPPSPAPPLPARSLARELVVVPPPEQAPERKPPSPAPTGVLVVVFGDDPSSVRQVESAVLGSIVGRSGLTALDPNGLSMLRGDQAALQAAARGDFGALASLGRTHGAEVLVVGDLASRAVPSINRFFAGSAELDLRMYRVSTGVLVATETYRVGQEESQAVLAVSDGEARSRAARQAGDAATAEMGRWLQRAFQSGASAGSTVPKIVGLALEGAGWVYIDQGQNAGMSVGRRFNVLRVVGVITDPDDGKVLKQATKRIGQIEVAQVLSQSSICKVLEGQPEAGDLLEPVQ